MARCLLSLVALSLFVTFIGCGPGGPKTYPVTGKVTIGGQPVAGIKVTFAPTPGSELQRGSGTSQEDGTYTLFTSVGPESKPGAMAGKYKVGLADTGGGGEGDGGTRMEDGNPGDPTSLQGRIPASYEPVEVEVTADGLVHDISL